MSHPYRQKENSEQCFVKRHAPLYLTGAIVQIMSTWAVRG
jgi:hypothetical protein